MDSKTLSDAKKLIGFNIPNNMLFEILFEMNRYFDKEFIQIINSPKYKHYHFNQNERNQIRKFYYYGTSCFLEEINDINDFERINPTEAEKTLILETFNKKCAEYGTQKIIDSVLEKYNLLNSGKKVNNCIEWLDYYNNKREKNSSFSLFILDYTQEDFEKANYEIDVILSIIADIYDHLENYRYFIFHLKGKLFNKNHEDISWQVLYKVGIFCENFISFKDDFFPFKKNKRIEDLEKFLSERFNYSNINKLSTDFYQSISTGFKFEDCLISNTQSDIILTYKKIHLDQTPIPCPICMTTIQSGNSYPELFLRSYECKNPKCSERSKSGRGKRFDEYGTYRYFKLVENSEKNQISEQLYNKWRRDIFSEDNDIYEMLLYYYAFDKETVCIKTSLTIGDYSNTGRNLITYKSFNDSTYNTHYKDLPIVKFFNELNNIYSSIIIENSENKILENNTEIINGNSALELYKLLPGQIGSVITSPPYYNAREYSHWSNMLLYFIDMFINCKSVYNTLSKDGYYFYNIGDIVNSDNVYVVSNMSKKRLQLGFLSCLIFETAGFNLVGNKIWDKGEVQSKRNSSINRISGYVKCINCYEHILIFKKGHSNNIESSVENFSPVIKINSKGENKYGHTAPYPQELVALLEPYIQKDKYVLDPFLGSGTTVIWSKMHGYKSIGYELNKDYYDLSLNKIRESSEELPFFN